MKGVKEGGGRGFIAGGAWWRATITCMPLAALAPNHAMVDANMVGRRVLHDTCEARQRLLTP